MISLQKSELVVRIKKIQLYYNKYYIYCSQGQRVVERDNQAVTTVSKGLGMSPPVCPPDCPADRPRFDFPVNEMSSIFKLVPTIRI